MVTCAKVWKLFEILFEDVISELLITFQMVSFLAANLFLSEELLYHD